MNELSNESSPYLLQHAKNPVYWKPWSDLNLAKAKEANKLVIISIGYSACHWCHVMEHESFEDSEVAQTMNSHFVNIKVDREERPDIDAVYMKAVQIMTSRGGWPLNVVCLPDGKPIWGGTYFAKAEWTESLEQLNNLYHNDPNKIYDYAQKLHQGIESISLIKTAEDKTEIPQSHLVPLIAKWKKSFDLDFGGYARAPKFMMPNNCEFLLRYAHQNNDLELLDFVNLTLTKMAYGGLFDTIEGGFSRYSVDLKWHIPHFEKMLYDNAQLISLYAQAYRKTKNPLYKEVIEKTFKFLENNLLAENGGFYCALDADSLNQKGKLEEGAFYSWTIAELTELIGEDFKLFSKVFNINSFGHWEHDAYVLIQSQDLENLASAEGLSVEELKTKKQRWETTLLQVRNKRPKPRLDNKILTSWNGLILTACLDSYRSFGESNYLKLAENNSNFILKNVLNTDNSLMHTFQNGRSSINGYLEDYCFVIEGFINFYQVTSDEKWLQKAKQLTDYCFEHFYDDSGFFRFTSNKDSALIAPHYEVEDNVIPASNSVMAKNLLALGKYFAHDHYLQVCKKMTFSIVENVDFPSAYSNWLQVFLNYDENFKEVVLTGNNSKFQAEKLQSNYLPNILLAFAESDSEIPLLSGKFQPTKNLFYICQNKTCSAPETDFDKLGSLLDFKY